MTKILYGMYEIAPANKPEPNTTKILYGMYALASGGEKEFNADMFLLN